MAWSRPAVPWPSPRNHSSMLGAASSTTRAPAPSPSRRPTRGGPAAWRNVTRRMAADARRSRWRLRGEHEGMHGAVFFVIVLLVLLIALAGVNPFFIVPLVLIGL